MDEEMNFSENDFDLDDDSLVTLADEDGNEIDFQILDVFSDSGRDYVALLSVEKPEEGVLILEVIHVSADEDEFETPESPEEADRLFEVFKSRNDDLAFS